jgi:hypothetical protein
VSYLVDPKHWKAFDDREQDLQRSAGAMFLGVEHPGDAAEGSGKSWLGLAQDYEAECGLEA